MTDFTHSNSLVIGLGGTGGRVLKELRKRMFDESLLRTDGHHRLPIAFMYIDSTDELMHHDDQSWMNLDGYNAQFYHNEFLNIGTIQPATIIEHLDSFPAVKDIVGKNNPKMFMTSVHATGQNRRIGRILFAANAQSFSNMLQEKVHELSMITGHDSPQHIFIVTGLAGGTGSGIVVDVIAQTHKRYPYSDIFVMVSLPMIPPPYGHDQGHYLANVYAALKELNALNVDAFKPFDIMTSGQRVDTNNQEKLQFTLIPFENGSIADCLHSFLTIIPRGDMYAEYFYRTVASGGKGHWLQGEYSTIEIDKAVRTLALASYAQKIVVHPKDMILRRISYSMQAQFIRQMRHNNYHEIRGFIDETKSLNYRDILLKCLPVWGVDNSSLTLQGPFTFIPHDSSNSFQEEWERMADYFIRDAVELRSNREERFNFLGKLYEEYYHTRYRHSGVEGYFNDRISDTYHYAQEICYEIQHDLFLRWYQGEYGLIDLIEIVKVLIDYLRDENENAKKRIIEYNELSVKCREEMEFVRKDFDHLNIFLRAIRAEQYLKRYSDCLREHYISLTHIHAIEFEGHLIDKLISRLFELENRLMVISSELEEMKDDALRIAEELRRTLKEHHNPHSPVVDLSNEDAIQCCIDKLVADKDEMERLSTLLRQKIAEHCDDFRQLECFDGKSLKHHANIIKSDIESYFLSLGKTIVNQEEINRLIDDLRAMLCIKHKDSNIEFVLSMMTANERNAYMESKEEIVRQFTYNNPFYENTLTALLYGNVCNKEHVDQFVYECINGLGVSLRLDDAELNKAVLNNPLPDTSIGNTKVFVSLPKPKTWEEERLWQMLENAFKDGSHNIHVNTAETGDEITIISLRTKFPIRTIYILPELKTRYDQLMTDDRLQASCMLWTEDSFADLPSLEVEAEQPKSSAEDENGSTDISEPLPQKLPTA